jgi:hypothetical protein
MGRTKFNEAEEQWIDANGVWSPRKRLKTKAKSSARAEQRRFERTAVNRAAVAVELDPFGAPGTPFECTIMNVSRGGVGLCAMRMVHIDRRLFIEVNDPDKKCRLLFGTVRQVRYVEAQGYIFGVQFEPIPTSGPAATWVAKRKGRTGGSPPRATA